MSSWVVLLLIILFFLSFYFLSFHWEDPLARDNKIVFSPLLHQQKSPPFVPRMASQKFSQPNSLWSRHYLLNFSLAKFNNNLHLFKIVDLCLTLSCTSQSFLWLFNPLERLQGSVFTLFPQNVCYL